ncbi:methyl-accepting chemotaxis protein [Desulfurispirillum indicum]|uniref:methyl-accepting chemotaxis protein n=1 Tax=Desulfurispirillum indicum TaxID=936456 RepID=UPI001CFA1B79|nr:methyl-accepting chemotaxis protein [Desulfurispirillum indicum]UCZ57083.1 methyl-accepting chemotaxis protein [Desulfurispirillum indicum]
MLLTSDAMSLTASERRWLPWTGRTGKLAMGWSCLLNRHSYHAVEETFEGIAQTRTTLLQDWTQQKWEYLRHLADQLGEDVSQTGSIIEARRSRLLEIAELFVVDPAGMILASTLPWRKGKRTFSEQALAVGLRQPFLHGPYVDPDTERIGPTTSSFHDAVTLMFHQPICDSSGQTLGVLCARVPNDVVSDLIQREAGHIYPESGDNYIFMVKPVFDSRIPVGTALSRSRFEDSTFSHGENLKEGIDSGYGVIKIHNHTEFEITFTDPATGQLHPGVRETIRNGQNLYIKYPGYSDYRHIPVIGKGVTFQLPGSLDTWGMMCEADLEEVYRRRSINYLLMRMFLVIITGMGALNLFFTFGIGLAAPLIHMANATLFLGSAWLFYRLGVNRIVGRMRAMNDVIRTIAEGGGNLSLRLDQRYLSGDETGEMARWINSFIDNLDSTIHQVVRFTHEARHANDEMIDQNRFVDSATRQMETAIENMLQELDSQMSETSSAAVTAGQMRAEMDSVIANAQSQFQQVRRETQRIRDAIHSSSRSIQEVDQRTEEIAGIADVINDIASQTNLLALNASIEAARAGQYGRGFAVVAQEVSKLAERTTDATKEISAMLTSVRAQTQQAVGIMHNGVSEVDRGLSLAEEAAADNSSLYDVIEEMLEAIRRISARSEGHAANISQVRGSTTQVRQSVVHLSQASDTARNTSSKLQRLMGRFRVSALS